ncbi:MAG: hypothetical protein ACRDLP_10825 [Solirubrobacteraceae bacterium]
MPRTASVVVKDPASVLTIDGDAIRAALRVHGGTVAGLIAS